MKLWLLRPVEALGRSDNPWEPWYDKTFGFVVRAETEGQARELSNAQATDENRDGKQPWLDPHYSSCIEMLPEGEPGIVMQDQQWA